MMYKVPFSLLFFILSASLVHGSSHCDVYERMTGPEIWNSPLIGNERDVPPPWTKITNEQKNIGLLNKSIHFHNSPLPVQVISDEQLLFRSAPKLQIALEGEGILASDFSTKIVKNDGYAIELTSFYQTERFKINLDITIEFDGYIDYKLKIQPDVPIQVDKIELILPFTESSSKSFVKYLPYDFTNQQIDKSGIDRSSGYLENGIYNFGFSPTFWVGNADSGIEWIAESNLNYSLTDPSKTHQLSVQGGVADFKTTFVDSEFKLRDDISYRFGFFVSPSRVASNQHKNLYLQRAMSVADAIESNEKLPFLNMLFLGHWNRIPNQYPGLPQPPSDKAGELDALIKTLAHNGISFIPYTTLYFLPSTLPELGTYEVCWKAGEKRKGSKIWVTKTGAKRPILPIALDSPSIRNFLLDQHAQMLTKYATRGVYLDVSQFWDLKYARKRFLERVNITVGEQDEVVFFPVLSHRDFYQRLWKYTKNLNPEFLIISHTGSSTPKHASAYNDVIVFGESFHQLFTLPFGSKLQTFPLAKRRQYINPDRYKPNYYGLSQDLLLRYLEKKGPAYMLLPEVRRLNDDYLVKNPDKYLKWSRSAIALAMEHDFLLWHTRIDEQVLHTFLSALHDFGLFDAEYEVQELDLYSVGNELNSKVIARAFRYQNKILYFFSNQQGVHASVGVTNLLSKSKPLRRIYNSETEEPINMQDNDFTISIPPQDYKLITIEFNAVISPSDLQDSSWYRIQ